MSEIEVGERIVGAIGVSGGHYTQDMEVAEAGLAALGKGQRDSRGQTGARSRSAAIRASWTRERMLSFANACLR
jgi:hypothetical protein